MKDGAERRERKEVEHVAGELRAALLKQLSRCGPSDIIRLWADNTYASFVFAIVMKLYLDSASRKNFLEVGASVGSLGRFRRRFTGTRGAVRSALRLRGHCIGPVDYERFLVMVATEFPDLTGYIREIQRVVPRSFPLRLSRAFQRASARVIFGTPDYEILMERAVLEEWIEKKGRIPIFESDTRALSRAVNRFLRDELPKIVHGMATDLEARAPEMIREEEAIRRDFEARLRARWGGAFDLLESIVRMAREVGEKAMQTSARMGDRKVANKASALFRLHIRGIQVTSEILALCRAGFADGALARWRSLHEIAVTALFLADKDEEMSRRYLGHATVQNRKEAQNLNEHHRRLGYRKVDKRLLARLDAQVAALESKYADEFRKGDYNWIPKSVLRDRNFHGLERHLRMHHLHPYVRLASNAVHGGSKGFFLIGVPDRARKRWPVAGSTDYGFADPLQNAGLSLVQLTACLFHLVASVETILSVQVMLKFQARLSETAMGIQQRMEEELQRGRAIGAPH